jgi:hypothetical protein
MMSVKKPLKIKMKPLYDDKNFTKGAEAQYK